MTGFGPNYFLHEVQFSAGIEPAHFPAETTRPLGRGCLPFSPYFELSYCVILVKMAAALASIAVPAAGKYAASMAAKNC